MCLKTMCLGREFRAAAAADGEECDGLCSSADRVREPQRSAESTKSTLHEREHVGLIAKLIF